MIYKGKSAGKNQKFEILFYRSSLLPLIFSFIYFFNWHKSYDDYYHQLCG